MIAATVSAPATANVAAASVSSADFVRSIESHRAYLQRAARAKLRDPSEIDDVVQDTIVAAWRGGDAFRGQSTLRTWLVGILNHKIVDAIRERQRRPVAIVDRDDDDGEGEGIGMDGSLAASSESASTTYERRRLCAEALDELEAYSPKAARIFMLREIEGEETPDICRELKVSSANCYVLLHRARAFLNERFAMAA